MFMYICIYIYIYSRRHESIAISKASIPSTSSAFEK